ncbi:MAG: hypothetical protein ABIN37_14550 [Burkholderiaceae bacterium]
MTTLFNAQLLPPVHLMDQVDIFLNIAEDSVDSEFESDFDDMTPEFMRRTVPNFGSKSKPRSSLAAPRHAKRTRGLAEVAAEVSRRSN